MPDRYGDPDDPEPVVDFDSHRQARQTAAATEAARKQRERLAETRTAHAPLTREQSDAARTHRNTITDRVENHRNALRIINCGLCDDDGYRGSTLCDHVDRSDIYARGMAKVAAALAKPTETQ